MNFLLDTNIIIYWLKGNKIIEDKVSEIGIESISISFITLSELYYGAYKSRHIKENLRTIELLNSNIVVLESNDNIAKLFGEIKADLKIKGKIIEDADIFIASCALINDYTLITNNEKHFRNIKNLKISNWLN